MEQSRYEFRITTMGEEYLPQISYALEKRTELLSRIQYPGMWNATYKLRASVREPSKGRRIFRKLLSVFCLICGIILFVPGLMKPQELLVPLIAGTIGIGTGIRGLLRGKIKRKNPFDKSARLLLEQRKTTDDARAIFTNDAMTIVAEGQEEQISYGKFEYVIEADSIFMFTFDGKVIVVKKEDMVCGDLSGFRGFIPEHTTFVERVVK